MQNSVASDDSDAEALERPKNVDAEPTASVDRSVDSTVPIEGLSSERWADWCARYATCDTRERERLASEVVRRGFYISAVWPLLEQATAQGVQHER